MKQHEREGKGESEIDDKKKIRTELRYQFHPQPHLADLAE